MTSLVYKIDFMKYIISKTNLEKVTKVMKQKNNLEAMGHMLAYRRCAFASRSSLLKSVQFYIIA